MHAYVHTRTLTYQLHKFMVAIPIGHQDTETVEEEFKFDTPRQILTDKGHIS
jgi:hypothetical protein